MQKKILIIIISIFMLVFQQSVYPQSTASNEYKVKAVFLYQFVNFVEGWKLEKLTNNVNDDNDMFLIGIIGKDPFYDAFEPLKDKEVKDRKITIRNFKGFSELKKADETIKIHPAIKDIKDCNLIFICASEQQYFDNILNQIQDENILTVSDTTGFLEKGGIINLIVEKNKVKFNVNTAAAKRANLSIRAKLLRLAKKVIEKDEIS